jgi:glyoxylase-like metal-dependent hydrolase (beta-lactamase superfamily II)
MNCISIPENEVVPMDEVAAGVRGLRIAFVNVFAITHPDGSWSLVDSGLPFTASAIQNWTKKFTDAPPKAIVLTHGHFDHVSAARDLADAWNVCIYAHPLEAPYLKGQKEYPAPDFAAGGGTLSLLSPLYPRSPIDLGNRLRVFASEGNPTLAEMPGWELVHTPGHTPGHVSFFRREDRCLIVGDAFCTTKPESFFDAAITQPPELHGPPAYFTSDWDSARKSVQLLSELDAVVVAPGHGQPLSGPILAEKLRQLSEHFDEVAEPESRKRLAA